MPKKYKLGDKHPTKNLYRIVALRDFGDVKEGDVGGWISGEHNLSHEGDCWVYDDSEVFQNAEISDNAKVSIKSKAWGNAKACGEARVYDMDVYDDDVIYVPITQASRHNTEKIDLSYLPTKACTEEAKVWKFGADKYGRDNWKKLWGEDTINVVMASLLRHAFAILEGEILDKESGEYHAAHIRCNAAMLIEYEEILKYMETR